MAKQQIFFMETASETCDPVVDLQARLSRICHDANNPLAVISGNAQLLLELAYALDLGEQLTEPIRDIEEASQRLKDSLRELDRLKEQL